MRLLISLSAYGDKNNDYLNQVLDAYKSYEKYDVTIDVHGTVALDRTDVNQIIHDNPKTTSLFHRQDFIRERGNYDLYLFAECDMMIPEQAIDVYLKYDRQLPLECCLGFIRYETTPENIDYLIDLWLNIPGYNYITDTNLSIGSNKYFLLNNVHQACYLLTRDKLEFVIDNTQYDYSDLDGLGVESSSSSLFAGWPLGPQGKLHKVLPLNKEDLLQCLIHHMPNCHCNEPGVNHSPAVFRSNTVTKQQLLNDLNL